MGIDAVHVSNAVIDGVDSRQERKLYLTHTQPWEDIDGRIRQQREAYPEGNCLFNGWTEDFEGPVSHPVHGCPGGGAASTRRSGPRSPAWLLELLGSKFGVPEEMLAKGTDLSSYRGSSSVFREWICSTCFWRWRSERMFDSGRGAV